MKIIKCTWIEEWIAERHYLGYTPRGARLRLAFFHDNVCVGGMLWGRPAARAYDPFQVLELSRMYLDDICPRNSESHCIGMSIKLIRKLFPEVHTLISYSDPAFGHTGTIYRAAGWSYSGETQGKAWNDRNGSKRKNTSISKKTRWIKHLHEGINEVEKLKTKHYKSFFVFIVYTLISITF